MEKQGMEFSTAMIGLRLDGLGRIDMVKEA